jgi:RHS repeat-associated protein
VKTVQEPFGLTLTYSYDEGDNRTVFQDSKGGLETFAYDAANNLTSVKFTNSLATVGFDYAYDARNAITKLTRYGSITGLATVGWTSFTYDSRGRLTNQQHRDSSNTSLNNTTFTYDNFDRLTTKVVNGTTTTYSYDNTNQLTDDGTASYSYDANGNRTMTGYTTGTGNQTTNDGTWTYSYDTEGNLTKKSKGASLETWNYSYDQQNHLLSVEKHATDGGTLQLKVQYKYDALDNRIERTEDSDGDGNVDITERFGYDGQNVWADLNTNNNITYRRLFGPGVDEPVARITAAGTVVWYLLDYQNSVIGMVDSTGSSLGSITYDGFGNVLTNTIGVNGDRYGYTSRESDSAVSLQFNRARYYDPAIGKWTSMDPLGFESGDADLYRYVGNGPTNAVDPSGLVEYIGKIEPIKDSGKTNDPLGGARFKVKVTGLPKDSKLAKDYQVSLKIAGKEYKNWMNYNARDFIVIVGGKAPVPVIPVGVWDVEVEMELSTGKHIKGSGKVDFKGPANGKGIKPTSTSVIIDG